MNFISLKVFPIEFLHPRDMEYPKEGRGPEGFFILTVLFALQALERRCYQDTDGGFWTGPAFSIYEERAAKMVHGPFSAIKTAVQNLNVSLGSTF
jgi:hypothetical protein